MSFDWHCMMCPVYNSVCVLRIGFQCAPFEFGKHALYQIQVNSEVTTTGVTKFSKATLVSVL